MEGEMNNEQEKISNNATIYDILKQEHKDVKKLFKQIVEEQRYQDTVYMQIKNALAMHMSGEEKVFYPRLENNSETRDLVLESYEEHDVGKKIINDIDSSSGEDSKFAKIKVLWEAVNLHLKEEEDSLFKKAKKVLSNDEEREIAMQFMNEKMRSIPTVSDMPLPNPNTPNNPNMPNAPNPPSPPM